MIRLNGKPVNTTLFPDNTSQVWHLPEDELFKATAVIEWEFSHEGEFMQLTQLTELLSEVDELVLHIDYLPYGRQDKHVSNGATFALTPFAALLNSLGFDRVYIQDPHSSRALELIGNSHAVYPHAQLQRAWELTGSTLAVYPDKGALVKYSEVYDYPNIHGNKERDQSTGYITRYQLDGSPASERVLIIDDICDGGKTFELLAHDLYTAGALAVSLFVTHGIFSKGLYPLYSASIQSIYTAKGSAYQMRDGGIGYKRL